LQNGKAYRQKEEQEDGGEQRAEGVEGKALRDAARRAAGNRISGEKPGYGGYEESKLQGALGTALGC
jgi:hypothetical protein